MKQEIEFNIMKLAHKAIHKASYPEYLLGFKLQNTTRLTRNQIERASKFETSTSDKLFIGKASRLLNGISKSIRGEVDHKTFMAY